MYNVILSKGKVNVMARMIPSVIPDTTESRAERELFPILRDSLSDEFTVFHSFNLLVKNRERKFVEGEIDFLIYSPKVGFLVLEVKGGEIIYKGDEGAWYQNDHLMKDPFEQARASRYKLQTFIESQIKRFPKINYAYAVCFPEIHSEIKILPSGADHMLCITGQDLEIVEKCIISIIESFSDQTNKPLSEEYSHKILRLLMPYCEFGVSLKDQLGKEERQIFALTEGQCQCLDFISNFKQAKIEGCAGSGKTIMAVKKARQLADKGNSVLLLSFNIMIGSLLTSEVEDLDNVTAGHYHGFCESILEKAGLRIYRHEYDNEYWENELPEAFADYIKENPIKYDAVIIDEGQDFRPGWWVTIAELVKDDGYFYIFYDPEQNLWGTDMEFPILGKPFTLNCNCRNTREIFDTLQPYAPDTMTILPESPVGREVVIFKSESPRQRKRQLRNILHDLVNEHSIDPDHIVVLGGHSLNHTCIGNDPLLGNFTITEELESGPGLIHYHTYMKFKGCEADAVILFDVDRNDDRWSTDTALYTTISRAKHLLYIIYC